MTVVDLEIQVDILFSWLIILKAFGWMNMILTESLVMYHLPSNTNSMEIGNKDLI